MIFKEEQHEQLIVYIEFASILNLLHETLVYFLNGIGKIKVQLYVFPNSNHSISQNRCIGNYFHKGNNNGYSHSYFISTT